jgi:hypothetical protein
MLHSLQPHKAALASHQQLPSNMHVLPCHVTGPHGSNYVLQATAATTGWSGNSTLKVTGRPCECTSVSPMYGSRNGNIPKGSARRQHQHQHLEGDAAMQCITQSVSHEGELCLTTTNHNPRHWKPDCMLAVHPLNTTTMQPCTHAAMHTTYFPDQN